MKKIVNIAPYKAELEEEHRRTHVIVRDEFGKQVLRANYDKFLGRWDGIHITTKKIEQVSDIMTVMNELAKESI